MIRIFQDLETTGLDPRTGVVLEVALIAVDTDDLDHPLERFSATIAPASWSVLDSMSPFVWDMHTSNKLLRDCAAEGRGEAQVVHDIVEFLKRHTDARFPTNLPTIAGNSPHAVDRPFFEAMFARHGLKFGDYVSHRQLDMTAVSAALIDIGFPLPEGNSTAVGTHRAMDDAEHALQQLRNIRDTFGPVIDLILKERALGDMHGAIESMRDRLGDTALAVAAETGKRMATKSKASKAQP